MRNLKRVLSLTLASVMLLGMMVVGSSAAVGYPDVAEDDNVEAIEVVQSVGVMVGDENGNFRPADTVSRAEMAVVMGKLLNLDYNYYEAVCPFTDVAGVYDWARGWVGAAAANGIVSGRGDGIYDPGATVTAVEAASMMMRALGYFKYSNDYADGFEVSTVRLGTTIGIFDGVGSSATEPMTRNQVAQMVLNALQSAVVEPDGNTINLTTPDGTVYTGKVNYVSVTSAKAFARAIGRVQATSVGSQNDGYIVELGERLYDGKLKLTDDYDPFGRPARNWEYDGKNVGVYAKKELMVFDHVGTVTGKDLYDLLGAKTIEDYTLTVNLDGVSNPEIVRAEVGYDGDTTNLTDKHNVDFVFDKNDLNRNNQATIGATGTGVLTQVFVDHEADTIDIAIVNTYLALADKEYDTKKEELAVTAYSISKNTASGEYVKIPKNGNETEAFKLAGEEFSVVKDAGKGAAFLLTVAEGEVQSVVPAEVLSAVQISAFKKDSNVVVDGTTYNFDTTAGFETKTLSAYTDLKGNAIINLKDLTYNVYLDAYGNLIGVEEVDAVKNYVFVTAIDLNDSNLVNGSADARAIFLDGTVDTIRVNMGKSAITTWPASTPDGGIRKNSILNTWCTYTVDNSGVYTLTQVQDAADGTKIPDGTTNKTGLAQYHETVAAGELTIDKKNITLKGKNSGTGDFARVYGDDKTVYLTAELDELINEGGVWGVISDVDTVSTGIEATSLVVWNNEQARTEADDSKTLTAAPGYANGTVSGATTLDWSKGVYTLYNDDGVIIAAVVVGEDNGASKNLVYVHSSSVDFEAYNSASKARTSGDGLFTWTRKVVSNGDEITLTEVSDGDSCLARMEQYNWYQIKTNGNGEVIAAYKLPGVVDGSGLTDAKLTRYEDLALDYHYYDKNENGIQDLDEKGEPIEIGEIAYTVQQGKSTVLYHNEEFINSYLRMSNRTLYVATDDQTGFIVDKNVNYVLQQWNSNKKDTFIETGSGSDGLENVIKELNDRYDIFGTDGKWTGKSYTYQISAVLENGVASSVIIYDNNNDYVRPGDTGSSDIGNVSVPAAGDQKLIDGLGKNTGLEILSSGVNTLTVEVNAPDWAKDANTAVTATATLMMDGKAYERKTVTANKNASDVFVGTVEFTNLKSAIWGLVIDPDEHTFAIQLSDITWANAGVKYVLDDGTKLTTDNGLTAGYTDKLQIGNGAPATLGFTYTIPSGYVANEAGVKYEVSNARTTASADAPKGDVSDGVGVSVANAYAVSSGWVTVTISGVEKDTTTNTPDPDADYYTVKTNTATSGKVLFAVLDADPGDEDDIAAIASDEWKTEVKAEEDQVVVIKSAITGVKLTGITAMETENGDAVTIDSEVPTGTGVFYFTVGTADVTITAVTTDEVTVESFFVAENGSAINVKTNMAPNFADDKAKADFVVAAIKGKYPTAAVAMTGVSGTTVEGVKIGNVTIDIDDIHVADDLLVVTVNTTEVVTSTASDKVSDALELAGITVTGGTGSDSEKVYITLKRTDNTTPANVGTWGLVNTTAGLNVTLAAGDVINTNGVNGYAKIDTATNKVTANTDGMTGANIVATIANADKVDITGTTVGTPGAAQFVKVGAAFTVSAKGATAATAAANTKGGKLEDASSTGATVAVTPVTSVAPGTEITENTEMTATVTLTAIQGDVVLKLASADNDA